MREGRRQRKREREIKRERDGRREERTERERGWEGGKERDTDRQTDTDRDGREQRLGGCSWCKCKRVKQYQTPLTAGWVTKPAAKPVTRSLPHGRLLTKCLQMRVKTKLVVAVCWLLNIPATC